MLAWVLNTYSGQDLMGHPELNVDRAKIGPLLSTAVLTKLQDQYLKVNLLYQELTSCYKLKFILEHGEKL